MLRLIKMILSFPVRVPLNCLSARPYSNEESLIKFNYHECCEKGINEQINKEFFAAYTYISLACHFNKDTLALPGFYTMFYIFSKEELEHGKKFMDYQLKRGGRLCYADIKAPLVEDWTPESAVKISIVLEKEVTQNIHDLHEAATKVNDQHLCDFLESEFLTEQYDAIEELCHLYTNVLNVGKGLGIHILDKELLKKYKKRK